MVRKKKKDNLPFWMIVGVITGAVIVYVASNDEYLFKSKRPPEAYGTESGTNLSGLSSISEAGVVLASGSVEPARNDVRPSSPEAPKQSDPIEATELPQGAILLRMKDNAISPGTFEVSPGAAILLAVQSEDEQGHIFMFNDESLRAVAIGVAPGETRAIAFNAPEEKGEYFFRCDMRGHAEGGETGKMIVR